MNPHKRVLVLLRIVVLSRIVVCLRIEVFCCVLRFSSAKSVVCEVKEGEMLYLPASWFHEVISFSGSEPQQGHMAFNYWMHPPTTKSYDQPYNDGFWESWYEKFQC